MPEESKMSHILNTGDLRTVAVTNHDTRAFALSQTSSSTLVSSSHRHVSARNLLPKRLARYGFGSSSGFGLRLVSSILKRGDRVIATARSLDKLKTNLAREAANPNCHIIELDIAWEPESIRSAIDRAVKIWGRIDVLVNNAGLGYKSLIEEASSREFKLQFQANLFGHIDVTNAVLPGMRERKAGTIVIMGSRSGWKSEIPATALYASSKAALRVYGETLATELAQFSIRVLIVEPGAFRTEGILTKKYHTDHPIADYDETRAKCIKIFDETEGRQPGDPEKAVELLVDVVRGEGRAEGKPWTGYLPMGADAVADIKNKCEKVTKAVDAWSDEATKLGIDT
ncbi:hypothetical protein PQX77_012786 [Marasmius sp. AFHP31]|nr:hypothetical protein PQX77_012786 [Marasmius sp. AFHP31]